MDDLYLQEKLDAPMRWIGLYIAVASAFCTLAMVADAFNGLRCKKLWFPSKFSSLNAISLTLLAVAMKLPMDLNTNLLGGTEWFAKFSSLIFMSTAIGNFMSSLGSMNDKQILSNVIALGILATTIAANVWIQLIQLQHILNLRGIILYSLATVLMLLMLATLVSLAITVPATTRSLESKYLEKHKRALRREEVAKRRDAFRIATQRGLMKKYWVMAETSNPQFVIARSVVSTTSSVICFLAAITLAGAYIQLFVLIDRVSFGPPNSVYGEFTTWIMVIQTTGVVVGTIVPTFRWFAAVRCKCSTTRRKSFKKEFKIETHWIQTLVDWRDSFSTLEIRHNRIKRYLHDAKWFTLTLCIGVQIFIVLLSKLLLVVSALLMNPFFLCCNNFKKIKISESHDDSELNLSHYVLLLDGEAELSERTLKDICHQADKVIQTGEKQQPQNLIHLLNKFSNFNGIREFDSIQVPSPHSQESPNCWTLPVVTLATIAIALPNIANHKAKQLASSISEGLSLAKIVDKTLDTSSQLLSIRKAADYAWGGVALYGKWQEIDLNRTSLKCKNSKEILQELSIKAERTIMEFKREVKESLMENPLNWPAKVINANSMYRISRAILLSRKGENEQTDEGLFEQLSVMVAGIFGACFTNLAHVITTMCHHSAIEKREKSVRKAFLLLGKTEQVLELLQQHEWPFLDHDKAAYIEEWRALFQLQETESPAASTSNSSNEAVETPMSNGEQITVTVDADPSRTLLYSLLQISII